MGSAEHISLRSETLKNPEQLVAREYAIWEEILGREVVLPPFPESFSSEFIHMMEHLELKIVSFPILNEEIENRLFPRILNKYPSLHLPEYPKDLSRFAIRAPNDDRMLLPSTVNSYNEGLFIPTSYQFTIPRSHMYRGGWIAIETIAQPKLPFEQYQITLAQRIHRLPPKRFSLSNDYISQQVQGTPNSVFVWRLPTADEWNLLAMREGWAHSNIMEHTSTRPYRTNRYGHLVPTDHTIVIGHGTPNHPSSTSGIAYVEAVLPWERFPNIGYRLVCTLSHQPTHPPSLPYPKK